LVYESLNWEHGVFIAASISSETTAAAEGVRGSLRHDPFAMLPFCGYNMGDYFKHWVDFENVPGFVQPKIFGVNWFRKNDKGSFLWPGFGENSRVLKWIFERCEGTKEAIETPIGYLPKIEDIDVSGLDIPRQDLETLLSCDRQGWDNDITSMKDYFKMFGHHCPPEFLEIIDKAHKRLTIPN